MNNNTQPSTEIVNTTAKALLDLYEKKRKINWGCNAVTQLQKSFATGRNHPWWEMLEEAKNRAWQMTQEIQDEIDTIWMKANGDPEVLRIVEDEERRMGDAW